MSRSADNLKGSNTQHLLQLPDEDNLETMEDSDNGAQQMPNTGATTNAATETAAAGAATTTTQQLPNSGAATAATGYGGMQQLPEAVPGAVNVAATTSTSTGDDAIDRHNVNGVQQLPGAVAALPSTGYHSIDSTNLNVAQRLPTIGEARPGGVNVAALPSGYHPLDSNNVYGIQQLPTIGEGLSGATNVAASPSHRKTRSLVATPTHGGQHRRRRNNPHHRRRSSIGEFLEVIGEDVRLEGKALKSVWTHELEEGHLGQRYFMDMNITRSLSILPEDILEFADEAVNRSERRGGLTNPLLEGEYATPPPIPHTPAASLGSYLALLAAVLAVSSNGTAVSLLHNVHPAMRLFWRMTAVSFVLSFFAIKTMVKQQREQQHFLPKLTWSQWLLFGAAAVCFFLHTLLLFTALTLTSIGNVVILANSQALLLVLGKALTGHHIVFLEGMGVFLACKSCEFCLGFG